MYRRILHSRERPRRAKDTRPYPFAPREERPPWYLAEGLGRNVHYPYRLRGVTLYTTAPPSPVARDTRPNLGYPTKGMTALGGPLLHLLVGME